MLLIKRVSASDFTPSGGSRISFDTDHLKCDDTVLIAGLNQCDNLAQRADGDFRAIRQTQDDIYKIPHDLSGVSFVTLSDTDNNAKYGMCIDSNNDIYISFYTAKYIKKYDDDGNWIWTQNAPNNHWFTGMFQYNDRIFVCEPYLLYIHEYDTSGNLIHSEFVNAHESLQRPRSIFVDSTGIYANCNSAIAKWDLSWNYDSKFGLADNDIFPISSANSMGIWRLSNGDFILASSGDAIADTASTANVFLVDSSNFKRSLLNYRRTEDNRNTLYTRFWRSFNGHIVEETNSHLFILSQKNSTLKRIDMREASERTATYQYDFGASVNVQRLNLNGLFDCRDVNWKNVRLLYQVDGGGYSEVDLKNPLLDVDGQVLDLKVGMTSYGFLRNWPKVYSVDIVYDDGTTAKVTYPLKGTITEKLQIKGKVTEKLEVKGVVYVKD